VGINLNYSERFIWIRLPGDSLDSTGSNAVFTTTMRSPNLPCFNQLGRRRLGDCLVASAGLVQTVPRIRNGCMSVASSKLPNLAPRNIQLPRSINRHLAVFRNLGGGWFVARNRESVRSPP